MDCREFYVGVNEIKAPIWGKPVECRWVNRKQIESPRINSEPTISSAERRSGESTVHAEGSRCWTRQSISVSPSRCRLACCCVTLRCTAVLLAAPRRRPEGLDARLPRVSKSLSSRYFLRRSVDLPDTMSICSTLLLILTCFFKLHCSHRDLVILRNALSICGHVDEFWFIWRLLNVILIRDP
jgi:hypothetical protein